MMNKLALKMPIVSKNRNNSSGFTLIELVVAAALSTIVLVATGSGLVFMNQNNKIAKSESERRAELNRALDFMADEIRQAQPTNSVTAIATDASSNLSTAAPNFTPTGKTPVLRLQLPGASEPVIYYLAAKPTGSPWFGPNIVYRWGPTMNNSGQYTDLTTPASWQDKPLVDSIVNTVPSTTPSCPSGWTLNPPSGSVTGFYACVDSTGKIASLDLRGTQSDTYGTSLSPYEVSSKAFARPELLVVANSSNPPFTTDTGTTTIDKPSTAYFEILGGDITCGAGGPTIETTTTINITPPGGSSTTMTMPTSPQSLTMPSLAAGTKVTVTGVSLPNGGSSNSCSGFSGYTFNSQTNDGGQVLTLRNGDTVPLFTPFGGQRPIDAFLTQYIDSTGKVKIADNQVIYLFEVGVTDTSEKAYDMQDIVVLATISPTGN